MNTWTADQLDTLGIANEIGIAPRQTDGSLRAFTTIWIVRIDDDLYVRSYNGPGGSWYRAARRAGRGRARAAGIEHDVAFEPATVEPDQVDDAYRAKYGRSSYVGTMTTGDTATTTLRLVPVGSE